VLLCKASVLPVLTVNSCKLRVGWTLNDSETASWHGAGVECKLLCCNRKHAGSLGSGLLWCICGGVFMECMS